MLKEIKIIYKAILSHNSKVKIFRINNTVRTIKYDTKGYMVSSEIFYIFDNKIRVLFME